MNLKSVPFLRFLIPFAGGLLTGAFVGIRPSGAGLVFLVTGFLVLWLARRRYHYRYRWVFGSVLYLALFVAGFLRMYWHNEYLAPDHFSRKVSPGAASVLIADVADAPSTGAFMKVPVSVIAIAPDSAGLPQACSGRLLLFVRPDSLQDAYRYGDRLVIRASFAPTRGARNPHAFDYARYLHFQNLHHQAFVEPDDLRVLSRGHGWWVWSLAYRARTSLLDLLHRYFPTVEEFAVASALLVGYKDEIPDALREAYTETGSMHALAVSGTHVGFLYAGLMLLLGRVRLRGRAAYWGKALLILAVIWAFTLLTGATASVMRASVMFSFYLIGKSLRRDASIWNVLSASAFFLLLYNPYFLFDAGFQLSYAAVWGMVYFYPKLYRWSPPMPRWPDEAWKVLLIGVAAQAGTLPLSLYYFHQFPVYFWLSGWVVVLGGAIFLWGGAVLVIMDAVWPDAAHWVGDLLYGLVRLMNYLVALISELPGSTVTGFWLPFWTVPFLYGLVWLGHWGQATRSGRYWLAMLAGLAVLAGAHSYRAFDRLDQRRLVVYSVSKGTLVDLFSGEQALVLHSGIGQKQEQFAAQANRWALGIRDTFRLDHPLQSGFRNGRFLVRRPFVLTDGICLAMPPAADTSTGRVWVDVLLVTSETGTDPEPVLQRYPCRWVVIDGSVGRRSAAIWERAAARSAIPCWNIRKDGAFEWEAGAQ